MSKSKKELNKLAQEAQKRIAEREKARQEAYLEECRAATDGFVSKLPEALAKAKKEKKPVVYSVPDGQYKYDHSKERYYAVGATKYLQELCQSLGLKAVLDVDSETIEYRHYESAFLKISE